MRALSSRRAWCRHQALKVQRELPGQRRNVAGAEVGHATEQPELSREHTDGDAVEQARPAEHATEQLVVITDSMPHRESGLRSMRPIIIFM